MKVMQLVFVPELRTALSELSGKIVSKSVSKLERKRVLLEIYAIQERLEKEEYKKASFSPNKFDIEDRNQQVFTDLEFYCLVGKTWSYIFDAINIGRCNVIADLCAGYSPKIELGLYYSGYKNRVVLLDNAPASSRMLIRFVDLIKPSFKIETTRFNILTDTRRPVDAAFGNHIVDDIVLDYFSARLRFTKEELYLKEPALQEFWRRILEKSATHAGEIIEELTPRLSAIVKQKGYLGVSHYAGYGDRLLGLGKAAKFNAALLRGVGKRLCRNYGFVDRRAILERALSRKKRHFSARDCILLQKMG